ncbi:hypothetical protein RRG08_051307 [Elysia crispata]|uniref:Uncharacterized protein n=1 Tax=Elysia crispata TaxID=231223 RepID=A0AAE0XS63_9GAST|nr:hypothetical protein RRG08_051307 [Elysia crispata]
MAHLKLEASPRNHGEPLAPVRNPPPIPPHSSDRQRDSPSTRTSPDQPDHTDVRGMRRKPKRPRENGDNATHEDLAGQNVSEARQLLLAVSCQVPVTTTWSNPEQNYCQKANPFHINSPL